MQLLRHRNIERYMRSFLISASSWSTPKRRPVPEQSTLTKRPLIAQAEFALKEIHEKKSVSRGFLDKVWLQSSFFLFC